MAEKPSRIEGFDQACERARCHERPISGEMRALWNKSRATDRDPFESFRLPLGRVNWCNNTIQSLRHDQDGLVIPSSQRPGQRQPGVRSAAALDQCNPHEAGG